MGKYVAAVDDHLIVPARVLQTRGQQQAFRLLGRPVPDPVPVRLLIDTGSGRSTLVPSVIDALLPVLRGAARIETSLAAVATTLFWVRLEFPGTRLDAITQLAVARLPLPPLLQTFQGVIGRDLLRRWESLLFEGRRGRFTLRDSRVGYQAGFVDRAVIPTTTLDIRAKTSPPAAPRAWRPCPSSLRRQGRRIR